MNSEKKPEQAQSLQDQAPQAGPQNAKERLYDQIKVPIWVLDIIIAACVIGVGVAVYLGTR